MDIIKVSKGTLTMVIIKRIVDNIYILLGNNVVGDVVSVEFDNDVIKLWHMRLGYLRECGMMELHKRNLLDK